MTRLFAALVYTGLFLAAALPADAPEAGAQAVTTAAEASAPAAPPPVSALLAHRTTAASYSGDAPVHEELRLCPTVVNRHNAGLIGDGGLLLNYTPFIWTLAGPLLRNPTGGACLSSGFGWRGDGSDGRNHFGIDLANRQGGPIYAAGGGVVIQSGWRGGYGNAVEIDHGAGVITLYSHLANIDSSVREGAALAMGQRIGEMGMTGHATGVHLHYELSVNGANVDPLTYGQWLLAGG
ncbi:MAG: M23 family metallopeptidase [Maricaulaceae bacterium]|nr:M23 family metallopeptidase [Maricaulaceae bacterium]